MFGKGAKNDSFAENNSPKSGRRKKPRIFKIFTSSKSAEEDDKSLFNSGLVKLLAAAFAVGCFVIIVGAASDCADKQKEIDALDEQIQEYELKNSDLQRILDNDDLSGYIEQKAVEERGYAYPDEYRFYDASRD